MMPVPVMACSLQASQRMDNLAASDSDPFWITLAGNRDTIFPAKEATPVFGPNSLAMLITCRILRSDGAAADEVGAIGVRSLLCRWRR